MKNSNLHRAKVNKNDEHYTLYADIEKEIESHHDEYCFSGKTVYCPCDDLTSNFWVYFYNNFKRLGLKKLIASHREEGKSEVNAYIYDGENVASIPLKSDGDFRNKACKSLFSEADIVITNPPFSLMSDFMEIVVNSEADFLIVGNKNLIMYKNIFSLFRDNRIRTGNNNIKTFIQPDGSFKSFGNVCWFTSLKSNNNNQMLRLVKSYSKDEYPTYLNYDAINVDRIKDIPKDYYGVMGVPITYMEKHNPEQFEIIGTDVTPLWKELGIREIGDEWINLYFKQGNRGNYTAHMHSLVYIDKSGKAVAPYKRILIRRRPLKSNKT